MLEQIINWDIQFFLFLNKFHSLFWDDIMWWISGKKSWIPLYLIILFFVFWKYKFKGFVVLICVALVILIADKTSVYLFKNVFERFRPCHNPDLVDVVHIVNDKCGGKYGFVSSHAANSFAFATFTSYIFRRSYYSVFILIWAAIVSYSRVYLGVHYPADIICGGLLGVLSGFIVFRFHEWFSPQTDKLFNWIKINKNK